MSETLRQLIVETQSKFKAEPESAVATFESHSALQEGLRSEVGMREHKLVVDEPPELGGRRCRTQSGRAGSGGAWHLSGDHLPRLRHSARHSARAGLGQPHRHDRPQGVLRRRGHGAARLPQGQRNSAAGIDRERRAAGDVAKHSQCTLPGARHHPESGAGSARAGDRTRARRGCGVSGTPGRPLLHTPQGRWQPAIRFALARHRRSSQPYEPRLRRAQRAI
jgi:hypothetical protein